MINTSSNSNNNNNNGLSGNGFMRTHHQNLSKTTSILPSSSPTVYISGLFELSAVGGGGNIPGTNVIVHQQNPHNSSGSSSSPKLSPVYPPAIDPSIAQQDSGLI